MIIITDYSIKLNTSKAKNDFDALIKIQKTITIIMKIQSLKLIKKEEIITFIMKIQI